jgi:hypothetical protein
MHADRIAHPMPTAPRGGYPARVAHRIYTAASRATPVVIISAWSEQKFWGEFLLLAPLGIVNISMAPYHIRVAVLHNRSVMFPSKHW